MDKDTIEFAVTSSKAFSNRAKKAADKAIECIQNGKYRAAMDCLMEAARFDAIAGEYELLVSAFEVWS